MGKKGGEGGEADPRQSPRILLADNVRQESCHQVAKVMQCSDTLVPSISGTLYICTDYSQTVQKSALKHKSCPSRRAHEARWENPSKSQILRITYALTANPTTQITKSDQYLPTEKGIIPSAKGQGLPPISVLVIYDWLGLLVGK